MENNIFEESDKRIQRIQVLLNRTKELFPKTNVSRDLLKAGYTEYKGITVPFSSVSHRYLYDYYDATFLNTFICLFNTIYSEKHSLVSEFTFRTLLEMGVEDSFILYDKNVSKDEKRKYMLIKTLVDYFSIETSMKEFFSSWFKNLYKENEKMLKEKLSETDFKIVTHLHESLDKPLDEKYTKVLKDGRNLCNRIKANILDQYRQKGLFVPTQGYLRIKSGESHMLHGNVFLIPYRFKQQTKENHLFRVYAYLMISTIDLLGRLSGYFDNKTFSQNAKEFFDDYAAFRINFTQVWAQHSAKTRT